MGTHTHTRAITIMPELKLTYFDFAGAAEPIRWVLHHGGIPFQDKRIQTREEFLALKATLLTGQVPVMHIDGEEMPQSNAHLQYVGRLADVFPEDALEAARVLAAMHSVLDHTAVMAVDNYGERHGAPRGWTPEEKKELRKNLAEKIYPNYFERWNKMLEGREYLANGKLSIADFVLATAAWYFEREILDGVPKSLVFNAPNVRLHQQRMMALPRVKKYLESIKYYNHDAYL